MVNPAEHNFEIYQGQTLKYPFEVWNDTEQTSAYDFTGHSVQSQARISYSAPIYINLNPTIVGNVVYLNATPSQLNSFVVQPNNKSVKYFYDIEITKPDSTKWTLVRGVIEIFPEVTK